MNPWLDPTQAADAILRGRGRGVKIAILDSGVEVAHPDLHGLELADDLAVIEDGRQIRLVPGSGRDLYGHGTAVAWLIRSQAPEAQIGSFRVFGDSLRSRTAIVLAAARAALERGYHVINCSLSSGIRDHWDKYKAWVDEAYLQGVHVIAACNNQDAGRVEWPAYFTSVIAVNMARCAGPGDLYYTPGTLVEFAARGVEVPVPWAGGSARKMTGSSFAVPHVTAMVARLLSAAPGLDPLQVKCLLRTLARPCEPAVLATNVLAPNACRAVA